MRPTLAHPVQRIPASPPATRSGRGYPAARGRSRLPPACCGFAPCRRAVARSCCCHCCQAVSASNCSSTRSPPALACASVSVSVEVTAGKSTPWAINARRREGSSGAGQGPPSAAPHVRSPRPVARPVPVALRQSGSALMQSRRDRRPPVNLIWLRWPANVATSAVARSASTQLRPGTGPGRGDS